MADPFVPLPDSDPAPEATSAPVENAAANSNHNSNHPWQRFKRTTAVRFFSALWDECDFWINTGAAKAGASAIAVTAVAGISYAVTLPFIMAAFVVVGCGVVVGMGAYGVVVGGGLAIGKARDLYRAARGLPPRPAKPKSDKKDFADRLAEMPLVKKMLQTRLFKRLLGSKVWKKTEQFTKQKQKYLLGGLAIGGSVMSIALGVTLIATQVMVLPILAIGTGMAITVYTTIHTAIEAIQKGRKEARERLAAVAARREAKAALKLEAAGISPVGTAADHVIADTARDAAAEAASKTALPDANTLAAKFDEAQANPVVTPKKPTAPEARPAPANSNAPAKPAKGKKAAP